jgi:hypothetical protein
MIFVLGRGGASIYGKEFADEITSELKHTGTYCTHSDILFYTATKHFGYIMLWVCGLSICRHYRCHAINFVLVDRSF